MYHDKRKSRGTDMEKVLINLVCYEKYEAFEDKFSNRKKNRAVISDDSECMISKHIVRECEERDFQYKNKIYFHMKPSQVLTISDLNRIYNKSDFAKFGTYYFKSRMAELTGNKPSTIKVFAGEILKSPRICLSLAKETFAKELKVIKNPRVVSTLREAIYADSTQSAFVLGAKEKKKFWKMIFPEFPINKSCNIDFNDRYFDTNMLDKYIECKRTKKVNFAISEKVLSDQSNMERKLFVQEEEIKDVVISDYLKDLIAFLHVKNKYNFMMPVNHLELDGRLEKKEEEKLENDEWLTQDDKNIMRICRHLLKYQKAIQREQNAEPDKIALNYLSFVLDFLKFCNEKKRFTFLNMHLFEDVFGFCYISEITDYLQKQEWTEGKLKGTEKQQLLNLLAKIFQKTDTETRIELSKYVIDHVYKANNKKTMLLQMTNLVRTYQTQRRRAEKEILKQGVFNGKKNESKELQQWNTNIGTLGDLYELLEDEAGFMMPYYKILAIIKSDQKEEKLSFTKNKDKFITSCLERQSGLDAYNDVEHQAKKILQFVCNTQKLRAENYELLTDLILTISYKCWEYCCIEVYE